MKIFDNHMHFGECKNIADTVQKYREIMERYKYEKINIVSLPYCSENDYQLDETANLCALYLKEKLNPKAYAYASLMHYKNETGQDLLKQAKMLIAMGFDGFKTLDGKPNLRKAIGIPLDDEIYDLFFEYIEKEEIPYLIHVGDIEILWHPEQLPQHYVEKGWFYDESYKTNSELFDEAEGILKKFPEMNIIFAHFMFKANDIDYCTRLMETYPNIKFDLTPHPDMFTDFSAKRELWRKFFLKYSDRIIYCTDFYDIDVNEKTDRMVNIIKKFLECEKEVHVWDRDLKPVFLPREILEKIYYRNAESLVGNKAKAVNIQKLSEECEKLKNNSNIKYILEDLRKGDNNV